MLMVWGILLHILLASAAFAADFTGQVVGVIDGDSLRVMHNGRAEEIRLNGIDCPEKGQAYGKRAKQVISALVFSNNVAIQTHGKDKYGRTIADVFLPDGANVNHTLVKEGWCWWYRKYAPQDAELEHLEAEARKTKKGLWQDAAPVPPWVYRKTRRGQALDLSDLLPLAITPASPAGLSKPTTPRTSSCSGWGTISDARDGCSVPEIGWSGLCGRTPSMDNSDTRDWLVESWCRNPDLIQGQFSTFNADAGFTGS